MTFETHPLQSILALFLLRPELYDEHKKTKQSDLQGYFFSQFRIFAKEYFHFENDLDAAIYFGSVQKERACDTNVCGGAGKMSHSAKTHFKSRNNDAESRKQKNIADFTRRHGIKLEPTDERRFLGIPEIWNHLERAAEIVESSPYANAASRCYFDETLTTPIPSKLDKHLIPLSIRTLVLQIQANAKRVPIRFRGEEEREEEEDQPPPKKEEEPKPPLSNIVFVPPEINEEDWL